MVNHAGKHIGIRPILTLNNSDLFTIDHLSIYIFLTINDNYFPKVITDFLCEGFFFYFLESGSDFLNENLSFEIETSLVKCTRSFFYLVNRHITSFSLHISMDNYS
jgi:hypothetical protein